MDRSEVQHGAVRPEQSHLFKEIHEQPAVLERLLRDEQATASAIARTIEARQISHVVIAARGTSDNAARYAQYLLGMVNQLPVALAAPSQFTLYQRPPRFGNALVLGISQSGRSPDIVAVLKEARQQGALTAVLTNEPHSDLAQQAEFVMPLHAGQERAVAATKTYTAELAAIALISTTLAGDAAMYQALLRMPEAIARCLEIGPQVAALAPRYRFMTHAVTIGRGYNYATAFELALKLKELTYSIVEPYSSADFLHGPLALIDEGFPVLLLASEGVMSEEMHNLIRLLGQHRAETLCISDSQRLCDAAPLALRLPQGVAEWLSPLTTIVSGQLLSMYIAHVRGFDLDRPRSILKVTETR